MQIVILFMWRNYLSAKQLKLLTSLVVYSYSKHISLDTKLIQANTKELKLIILSSIIPLLQDWGLSAHEASERYSN